MNATQALLPSNSSSFVTDFVLPSRRRPDRVRIDVASMADLGSYSRSYYVATIKTLVRSHRLFVDRELPIYETTLTVDPAAMQRWVDLFELAPGEATPRFSFVSMVGTLMLTRVVSEVGVNFRNLLHLRHEDLFHSPDEFIEVGVPYSVSVRLSEIVPLRADRVALVVETRVCDPRGARVQTMRDSFIILDLDPYDVDALRQRQRGRAQGIDPSELVGLGKRAPRLSGETALRRREQVVVPEDMGKRYGRTSGDMNMVHTTALAARIFGFRKPFIQGLCTANYVLRAIARSGATARALDLRFARRVDVGSELELLLGDEELEVVGGAKLRVFGTWAAW